MKNLRNLFIPLLALVLFFCCSEDSITESNESLVETQKLSEFNDDLINQNTNPKKDKKPENTQQNQDNSLVSRGPAPELDPESYLYENCFDNATPTTNGGVLVTFSPDFPELNKKAIRCYYVNQGTLLWYKSCKSNVDTEIWYISTNPCYFDISIPDLTDGGAIPPGEPDDFTETNCDIDSCQ